MTNLTPVSSFDNVPQLETTTPAKGGPGGPINLPAQALLNRTQYLYDMTSSLPTRVTAVESGQSAGMLGYATKALMDADLAHADSTLALVTNDATTANNATYRKTGASGSGSWVLSTDRVTVLDGRISAVEPGVQRLATSHELGLPSAVAPVSGSAILLTVVQGDPSAFDGRVTKIRGYGRQATAQSGWVAVFDKTGDAFTLSGATYALSIPSGSYALFVDLPIKAGQYVGAWLGSGHAGSVVATADGVGWYAGTANSTSFSDTTLESSNRLQVGFDIVEEVSLTTFKKLSSSIATNAASAVALDRLIRNIDRSKRIVAAFGDSRASQEIASGPPLTMNTRGVLEWAAIRSNQRIICDPALNFGVGGERTDQFLLRIAAVKRCTAPVIFIPGWVNDSAQSIASATTQANLLSICQQLRDSGKIVILADDYPPTTLTAPQMAIHVTTRDYVRTLHNPTGGVYVARTWDTIATVADGTTAKANVFADGLHPAPYGGWLEAAAVMTQMNAAFLDSNILGGLSANLVTNPTMDGIGGFLPAGGATGQVASGWVGSGPAISGAGTIAFAKVSSGGRTWQQVSIGGTGWTSAPTVVGMSQDLLLSNFNPGDTFDLMCMVESDASVGLRSIKAQLLYQTGVAAGTSGEETPAQFYPIDPWTGVFHFRCTWPAGATRATVLLQINTQTTSPVAVVRFSAARVSKVT